MMINRFERLYKLPTNLYSVGSPIIVTAGSLLKDTQTGNIIAQIKYQSVSSVPIKALQVNITAYDIAGQKLEYEIEYQYLDLNVINGEEFGSNKAIIMPNTIVRSFSLNKLTTIFTDGTIQNISAPTLSLTEPKPLQSTLRQAELIKQYQISVNYDAIYAPQETFDLWQCVCGRWNRNAMCSKCRSDKETVFTAYNIPTLTAEMKTRIAIEKAKKEEKDKLDEIERKIRTEKAQKRKKKLKKQLLNGLMASIVIFLVAITLLPIVRKELSYFKANQLSENGNFVQAYEIYQNLGDYKDSQKQLEKLKIESIQIQCKISQVGDLVSFGTFEQDNNLTNGPESIEWIILKKDNNTALLISKHCLAYKPYHNTYDFVNWEDCWLREWLNNEFVSTAFTTTQQQLLNRDEFGDICSILSYDQVTTLLRVNTKRISHITAYAHEIVENKSLKDYTENFPTYWWVHSSDFRYEFSCYLYKIVNPYGTLDSYVAQVAQEGVRPIILINIGE